MRLLRFLKRLKRKYRILRRFATRRQALYWCWIQSKKKCITHYNEPCCDGINHTDVGELKDYDKIEITNIKEIADKIIKDL